MKENKKKIIVNILFVLGGIVFLLSLLYLQSDELYPSSNTLYLESKGLISSDEAARNRDSFLYVLVPSLISPMIAFLLFINIFMKMESDFRQMRGISRIEKIEVRIGKIDYRSRVIYFIIATGLLAYSTYPSFDSSRTLIEYNWWEIFNAPFFWSNVMMALFFFIVMPKMKDHHMDFDKSDAYKDT